MRRRSAGPETVPLTIRALTRDGADVRLLLEAEVRTERATELGAERIVHALVVPALERWVARQSLSSLSGELESGLSDVADQLEEEMALLGTELHRIDVAAVEHLLRSPSAGTRTRG